MKTKKILAAAAALAVVCGAVPSQPFSSIVKNSAVTANAADIVEEGNLGENVTYTLTADGVLTISGTGDMYDYAGAPAPFKNPMDISEVIIENGVTSIGFSTFSTCVNMKKAIIPESMTYINQWAFARCSSLESIDQSAFWNCANLTNVIIPDSVKNIGVAAFMYCSSLTDITIPNSVTSIGFRAFADCESLTISGYAGSAAETYAKENGIEFISLGDVPTPEFTLGDVDGDGKITSMDASAVLTYYVMQPDDDKSDYAFNKMAADWDGNGIINAIGASAILTYYVENN